MTSDASQPPLTKADLVAALAGACKPREQWRIGTEHEKLVFALAPAKNGGCGYQRLSYELIAELLRVLQRRYGWQPVEEGGRITGLQKANQSISLEPGGQLELSGAPLHSVHDTAAELREHLLQIKCAGEEMGLEVFCLGSGFDPVTAADAVPRMPKDRYNILGRHFGHDMMFCTATTQVNLDFESEADMVEKYRVALALQPVATALFANSPFRDGRPSGYLSWRAQSWMAAQQPSRGGNISFVFEPGFGFDRYAAFALHAPLYFVTRGGTHCDLTGGGRRGSGDGGCSNASSIGSNNKAAQVLPTFQDFMQGRLPGLPGMLPTLPDWIHQLGLVWPIVRLKAVCLEMRGADCGPFPAICALPALWVGLLYDAQAQAEAAQLVAGWSQAERAYLHAEVPRLALRTPFRGKTVGELAQQVLSIARGGLERRGLGEALFLRPLGAIAESSVTQAERLLQLYEGPWGGSLVPLFSPQFATAASGTFAQADCAALEPGTTQACRAAKLADGAGAAHQETEAGQEPQEEQDQGQRHKGQQPRL